MNGKIDISKLNRLKIIAFASVLFLFSCSPVKFVPEEKYLVSNVQVEIDNQNIINDARYEITGCAGAISAAMAAVDLVKGKTIEEALKINDGDVFKVLEKILNIIFNIRYSIYCSINEIYRLIIFQCHTI